MSIWFARPQLATLNAIHRATAVAALGIEITEVGEDYLAGTMPVDERTRQPAGLLHGGASVLLAETLGTAAAIACVDPATASCVGLEINANHLRGVRNGLVTGIARPLRVGRTSHVWSIDIRDATDQLVCVSRLTVAVTTKQSR